jgi:hypothetical protein
MKGRIFTILSMSLGVAMAAGTHTGEISAPAGDETSVIAYPPLPNNTYQSNRYAVTVEQNGRQFPCYVYQSDNHGDLDAYHLERMTAANHFTSFSFQGRVTVNIHLLGGATAPSALVHPFSYGVKATSRGSLISLVIEKPRQIYVEVPGMGKHPIFIFADPPERNVPSVRACMRSQRLMDA